MVVATHDAGMVDQMRRRVIELDRGVLVRDQAHGVYGIDRATGGTARVGAATMGGTPELSGDGARGGIGARH
jgi:cell division transport system ATP-binding protein